MFLARIIWKTVLALFTFLSLLSGCKRLSTVKLLSVQERNATNQNGQMFWTKLKHSLDTNTTTHTDEQRTWHHNYRGESRAGQSLSIMSERGPPTAEEDMKTFNQNNFVPALLAFNYILNTHTHTHIHLCRNTRVCALAIVKSC